MNLAKELEDRKPLVQPSPLSGFEYVNGYGIFACPFDSGHVLALRVFPENDFGAYVTIWHRTPDGDWSIYVDGPSIEHACPRYYGAASKNVENSTISLNWTGPHTLRVESTNPRIDWTVHMTSTALVGMMNRISTAIPESLWRTAPMLRTFEWVGQHFLNMGSITLSGIVPNGHYGILMPQRMYFIEDAKAVLDDQDLGNAVRSETPVSIGDLRLPQRPTFAIGRGYFSIA